MSVGGVSGFQTGGAAAIASSGRIVIAAELERFSRVRQQGFGEADGLIDPWGRAYQYRFPGKGGQADVFTLGRDNASGGADEDQDITN